jgi:hypothetical protein
MKSINCHSLARYSLTAALAATALVAIVTTAPPAQAAAQHAHEGAPQTSHKLALDHGKKWATDEPLRAGMDRIRDLVEPAIGQAHAGKLDAARYRTLAGQVEVQVGDIVGKCKLEPQADAMLHPVIARMLEGTDAMAGKNRGVKPVQGLVKVAAALNDYGAYFDHPGFKPIRIDH